MAPSRDIARRDFCRLVGCTALGTCALALSGCSKLLAWSESQHAAVATRKMAAGPAPAAPATQTTAETTPSLSGAAPRPPDLAVRRGADPAANVRAALEPLGGMTRFVKRGAHVVLKPNVLTGREPQFAVTTNPELVGALVVLALEAGAADVTVFDRPTSPARSAFEVSGILAAVEKAGGRVKLLVDRNFTEVRIPGARQLGTASLVSDVFDADVFINVPIAKTHSMAGLTMAMKNLMGVLGGERGVMHQDFATKICDLNSLVRPHLVVLDAHRILVANGPSGGSLADVREPHAVVVGTNAASVDAYGATLFGMKPTDLDYLVQARDRGLGEIDLAKLTIDEKAV